MSLSDLHKLQYY